MSFSSEAKNEMCRQPIARECCARAECYGIALYCHTFDRREIRIVTANDGFAQRLPRLFRRAFSLSFDVLPPDGAQGKRTFLIRDPDKIFAIFSAYGQEHDLAHHINYGVLESDCCRQSFLRGAFLAGGSVTDPEKRYHLELLTSYASVSREAHALMLEMGFSPREAPRSGGYITYFKQSEAIEDVLTTMGAPLSAMGVMQAKMQKDMRNAVNRRVNCDSANVDKAVEAAQLQIESIRRLGERMNLEELPPKLREAARLRVDNPDLTLSQLAALCVPPITKSSLSARLRKLAAMAEE